MKILNKLFADVAYDNTLTNLNATTIQEAIDRLFQLMETISFYDGGSPSSTNDDFVLLLDGGSPDSQSSQTFDGGSPSNDGV
jgi:hypothetical protein